MNRKKLILLVLAVASMAVLAGCSDWNQTSDGEELAEDTGEDLSDATPGESYAFEVRLTEKNQYGLVQAQPPQVMENSLERQNLNRRYDYLNDINNVHHVYLMSHDGKVVAYYTAQGKVSSVNSKLTNDKQIVATNECLDKTHKDGHGACFETVESPQMDGSYGENGDAIFFFTAGDGSYVEWNGLYVVSEEPKNIQSEVTLVETVGEQPDPTNESEDE